MEIIRNWEVIVGQSLASHALPDKIYRDILWVKTDHSIFSQQIQNLSNEIREKVKTHLGIEIYQIRTKTGLLKWNVSQDMPFPGKISAKGEKKSNDIMSTSTNMSMEADFERFILKIQDLS